MSDPSDLNAEPEDPVLVAAIERMLDLAPYVGIAPEAMAHIARRLQSRESERVGTLPSRRRDELDALIAEDVEALCLVFARLRRVVGRMPKA